MANIRNPQFGIEKDELSLTSQDPASVLYGVNPNNRFIPVKVTNDGSLVIGGQITLEAGDLEIGAVEIKNYNTDDRAYVSPAHEVLAQARVYDALGNAISSTSGSLNVNVTNSSGPSDHFLSHTTDNVLVYGNDGTNDQKLKTDINGQLQVGIVNASIPVTQSGIWNLNNITGTITLPTGAATETTLANFRTDFNNKDFATETTLLGIKTDTDKFTFASSRLLVDGSQVTQPISAVSLPLPTGAATESTLATRATEATLSTRASESTLSGFRTDFNAVDFATETTLSAIKTDTDKFTFAATRLLTDGSGVTQPISAVALPLPSGAATESTLAAIKAQTDLLTFSGSNLLVTAIPDKSATPTRTDVARTNATTTILAANSNRKGATIYNDSSANLFIKFGATATTSDFTTRLQSNDYYEVPFNYTGRIDGIWASNGTGAARVTELS